MKIVYLVYSEHGPKLVEGEAPAPKLGPEDLLIRVHAAGITPTELLWYPTSHRKTGEARVAAVPSHEFSGVVAETGTNVGSLEVGHEVFGMNDWFEEGALAEYCVAPFSFVAPKPANLTHIQAASVPIGALTAWQGLFDRAKLQPGQRVLVHGGSGAVGTFAIQLAKHHGARVIATAAARNLDFVTSLGAEQVIDYEKSRFEQIVSGVDVVFDTVGGETLERSWGVLKHHGRMITIAAAGEQSTEPRVKDAFFIVEPNQKQLSEIGDLFEQGHLRPVIDGVVPFSQAPAAFAGRVERQGRGKLVVSIAA